MSAKKPVEAEVLPAGFQVKDGIAWGSRMPHLLEIKFHNARRKNSTTAEGQSLIKKLITDAQTDPHNYSVGTNLVEVNSYGPQIVFKDLMKHAQEWVMFNPTTFDFIRNPDGSLANARELYFVLQTDSHWFLHLRSADSKSLLNVIFWMAARIRCRQGNMK